MNPAIGYVQFHLRGGLKNLLSTTALYAVAVIAAIIVTARMDPARSTGTLFNWTMILLSVQGGILVLFAGSRVSGAIVADVNSGMIHSHRLMPVNPASAIAGYIWGSAAQALGLAAATFVIGAVTAAAAGVSLQRWFVPNMMLVIFALFVASLSAFGGFIAKGLIVIAAIIGGIILTSEGAVLDLLPGLAMVVGPMVGPSSIFSWRTRVVEIDWLTATSIATQLIFAAIFFVGAVQKYRRPDRPGLRIGPALVLLAAWIAACTLAIYWWDEFSRSVIRHSQVNPEVQLSASILAAMIISLIALMNAARLRVNWHQRRAEDPFAPKRGPLPAAAVAVLAAGIILVLPAIASPFPQGNVPRLAGTAAVLLVHGLTIALLMNILYRWQAHWSVLIVWLLLTWATPVCVDALRSAIAESEQIIGRASAFSPAGAILCLWRTPWINIWPGVGFQMALAGVLGMIGYAISMRDGKEFAETAGSPAHGG